MPVSWIIPVRDGRRWIAGCLGSVLADAAPDDQVIVVDDGSTDGTLDGLAQDPRIVLLRQGREGIVAALERGRAAARHAFLGRVDVDDRVVVGRREAQLAVLNGDTRCAVVGGRARLEGALGEGMRRYVDWVNSLEDPHTALLVESPLFHPATMLRAEAIEAVGGYRQGPFPEDYDLWLRLVAAGWRLRALHRDVVQITDREERLTRTDPRYARNAFRDLKMAWVGAHLLGSATRVVVWGAGRTGRPWIRFFRQRCEVVGVVDAFARGVRQGITVAGPEALAELVFDQLFVCVGARGARPEIRRLLQQIRPDLVEGVDWWALA